MNLLVYCHVVIVVTACLYVCICRDDEILIRERVIHRNVGVSSCQADVGAQGYVVLASVPNHLSKYKWIVST